jgi:hypothetical protein
LCHDLFSFSLTGVCSVNIQNETNVGVVTAQIAKFAIYPPKWQADVRERTAELTQLRGGWPGYCHRVQRTYGSEPPLHFWGVAAVIAI